MGLDLDTVRIEVENQVAFARTRKSSAIFRSLPRVMRVLALAAKEARALDHTYVGTEHILLGLLLEGDGVVTRVLKTSGVDTEKTRVDICGRSTPTFRA